MENEICGVFKCKADSVINQSERQVEIPVKKRPDVRTVSCPRCNDILKARAMAILRKAVGAWIAEVGLGRMAKTGFGRQEENASMGEGWR